jgi:hypothetical protein
MFDSELIERYRRAFFYGAQDRNNGGSYNLVEDCGRGVRMFVNGGKFV